ncbi:hypothetical protein B4907_13840 [Yersinia kristensenii]|nr:hypothetical protein B4907_13840 [Yersinia kristensenii]
MYARLALIALALTATQADAIPYLDPRNAFQSSEGTTHFNASVKNMGDMLICSPNNGGYQILLGADLSPNNARLIDEATCPNGDRYGEFLNRHCCTFVLLAKVRPSDRNLFIRSYIQGVSHYAATTFAPHIKCSLNWSDVDLGIHSPQNAKVTNSNSTIRCTGDATVSLKLPRPSMEFTEGATSQVSFLPSSGIITALANRTTPIPLVFDTTVSSSSAAGEYTQNLVVTAEYQ